MPKTNELTVAMVGKILILNILFHVLSGIFTGVWISDLVAPTGEMTLLTWLETVMSAVAIAAGLSYGSYIALTHIPMSIGVQTGPPIGAQKGPPFTMAQG